MKNNPFKNRLYILSIFCLLAVISCTEDEKLPINFEELKVSGGAFASEVSTEGSTNVNKLDPASSLFTKEYTLSSPNGGTDVSEVSLYVSFTGLTQNVDEVLYSSTNSFNGVNVSIPVSGDLLLSSLGLMESDLEGGDTFNYRLSLTTPDGEFSDVSSNFAGQSADHTFSSSVICELPEVPAGDWIVQMEDSFGDGWQTDNGNGGPGISVTLNTGDVLEVGLCSPYETPTYDCTDEASSGTATITIPAGITSAVWFFPGDFYGEISFTIISPSGNIVAEYAAGGPAGDIALNLCNE